MLNGAAGWLKPGGLLVYCTCSLEPEEGERQIDRFLKTHQNYRRLPLEPAQIGGQSQFINENGDLRVLPGMAIGVEMGLDGFFAARLERRIDS
jgi:16S rRNA (cytosine967-C5)-methyltransferase